jgi:DNA-binding NarL/FixJ family response regulator
VEIVGEASELGSLLIKTEQNNPDIVLLNWELAHLKVSDIIPLLRAICPGLKIIAMSTRPESSNNALAAGADAFVSKGDHPEKLLDTLKTFESG